MSIFFKKYRYFVLIAVICWFILFEITPSINIPEVRFDEVYLGVKALKLINNLPPSASYINFLGRYLPIANSRKHGAMEIYLLSPFIFFGSTLEMLRIGTVLWGVLILLLTYYFCSRFFNPAVGLLSIIFLATNNTFISLVKIGGYYGFSMPIFTISALLFLFKWGETKKNLYFYIGMFLLGLGFNTQGYFIWFIIAFIIGVFSAYFPSNKIKFRTFLSGLVFILLGSVPILYHYFISDFFANFAMENVISSRDGVHNLNIFSSLLTRFRDLNYVIGGSYYNYRGLKDGYNFGILFSVIFFWFCTLYLSYLIFIKRKTLFTKQRVLFILSVFLLTFIMSAVTFTDHKKGHLYILFPFIQIIMNISIFEMSKSLVKKSGLWKILFFLLVALLIVVNMKTSLYGNRNLRIEKVKKSKCNISTITSWLVENKKYRPAVFNPLMEFGPKFYSNLKVNPFYLPPGDKDFSFDLENIMFHSTSEEIFAFSVDDTMFSNYDVMCPVRLKIEKLDLDEYKTFKQLAKKLNKKVIVRKKFLYSDGRPRYLIVSLK